jgi:hypothetical protein
MSWLTRWLSANGKHVVSATMAALFAFNQVYPILDPHLLNAGLAGMAALGLYSGGQPAKKKGKEKCDFHV